MHIDAINKELRSEHLKEMTVESFDAHGRKLVVSFTCNGGPRESDAFIVTFNEAVLFHLPSVLYEPAFFRFADESERARLVPEISYDAQELSGAPNAYSVLLLEDDRGEPYGYYLAADSVSASWRSRTEGGSGKRTATAAERGTE
jgi:hypothetical protein